MFVKSRLGSAYNTRDMPNCRSISQETWAKARQRLIFYFSRRHCRSDAEDLAQETLLAILKREGYEFEKEEDFFKICYGFAENISKQDYREARRRTAAVSLEMEVPIAAPQHQTGSQRAIESGILLEEVLQAGESQLVKKDWEVIKQTIRSDRTLAKNLELKEMNNLRVRLHRIRKKLASLLRKPKK